MPAPLVRDPASIRHADNFALTGGLDAVTKPLPD